MDLLEFMKYQFPKEFPLRYAIVVDYSLDIGDEYLVEQVKNKELLFNQLIHALQTIPINENFINGLNAEILKTKYLNIGVASIPRLNPPNNWGEESAKMVRKILPDTEQEIIKLSSIFGLHLVSYKGIGEIPVFYKSYLENSKKNTAFRETTLGIESLGIILNDYFKLYSDLMDGEIGEEGLFEFRTLDERSYYLNIPNAEIWARMEKGLFNGISPALYNTHFNGKQKNMPRENEQTKGNQKIGVMVCRSWASLFVEEISSLYHNANFCRNCGKVLPKTAHSRKFCLNTDCIRERNRLKKRKSQKSLKSVNY